MVKLKPLVGRGDFLWRLNADFGIPFSRRQNNHLVQKLIYAGDEILPISGLIGDITEELGDKKKEDLIWIHLAVIYCFNNWVSPSSLMALWRFVKYKLWNKNRHFDLSCIQFKNNCHSVINRALETLLVECIGACTKGYL